MWLKNISQKRNQSHKHIIYIYNHYFPKSEVLVKGCKKLKVKVKIIIIIITIIIIIIIHLISARRPDFIIINKKKKEKKKRKKKKKKKKKKSKKRIFQIVNFVVPADHRIQLKEYEKKDKYLDLARE